MFSCSGLLLRQAGLSWCRTRSARTLHRTLATQHCTGDSNSKPYFVTTPIFYVNAAPHLGHLYCCLLADVASRWRKIKGQRSLFTVGTDEHGLKIQQAAAIANKSPKQFCDEVSGTFKDLFDAAGINYSVFQRTTDEAHVDAVQAFWTRLEQAGHIYRGTYAGWYSVSDEAFLQHDDVEERQGKDGTTVVVSKESGHVVTWTEEENYKFRLSDFQQDLLYWLNTHPIHPPQLEPVVRKLVQTLPDLSVSRESSRLPWGVRVPGDDSQTIYVWLDALINYLTATGFPHSDTKPGQSAHTDTATPYPWPPDCQIIGKDILRFHAVYWPAFLLAANLEPPRRLVVHSHWLADGVKMSKSLGNVVDPLDRMQHYGVDGFRYFLLKEGSLTSDCSYSEKRVAERVNTDLANTLGNLLGRSTAPSVNRDQCLPPLSEEGQFEFMLQEEREVHRALYNLPEKVDVLISEFQFPKALDLIFSQLRWANAFVQAHEPWVLSKASRDGGKDTGAEIHLETVLHVAMETLRVSGILLQPFTPTLAHRLLTRLGVPSSERSFSNTQSPKLEGHSGLGEKVLLYKKVSQV